MDLEVRQNHLEKGRELWDKPRHEGVDKDWLLRPGLLLNRAGARAELGLAPLVGFLSHQAANFVDPPFVADLRSAQYC